MHANFHALEQTLKSIEEQNRAIEESSFPDVYSLMLRKAH